MKKESRKFVFGGAAIVVIFGVLIAVALQGSQTYYYTVEELMEKKGEEGITERRMRVAGNAMQVELAVKPLRFMLEYGGKTLPVTYIGLKNPPDTFADGVETVVTGKLEENGTFAAEQIQCKCGSKYEPSPLDGVEEG